MVINLYDLISCLEGHVHDPLKPFCMMPLRCGIKSALLLLALVKHIASYVA